jgi:hypothetical protein
MRILLWYVAGVVVETWTGARPPSRWEQHMTLTADAVAQCAADPPKVDPQRVRWNVRRGADAWVLRYDYPTDAFTVRFRAVKAHPGTTVDSAWDAFEEARELDALPGADRRGGRTFRWGDQAECEWIHRFGQDVGYRCRGRAQDRLFTATVWGVTAEEARPEKLLAYPLHALAKWNPETEP